MPNNLRFSAMRLRTARKLLWWGEEGFQGLTVWLRGPGNLRYEKNSRWNSRRNTLNLKVQVKVAHFI